MKALAVDRAVADAFTFGDGITDQSHRYSKETEMTEMEDTLAPRILTRRDVMQNVPRRWRNQYPTKEGRMAEKAALLEALDTRTCDRETIDSLIGNKSWTRLECDGCGVDAEAVVIIGGRAHFEAASMSLCVDCIDRVHRTAALVSRPAKDSAHD